MARTKGAKGKKNLPTSKEFNENIKCLTSNLVNRLHKIALDENSTASDIIRSAGLVLPLAEKIFLQENTMDEEVISNKKQTKEAVEDKPKNNLVSFTAKRNP